MTLLGVLAGIAVLLTLTMFVTRQAVLGFACAMFWFITGAQAYTLSTTPWGDIYFFLFFAAGFGMTIFTSFAAFGLRERRDSIAEDEMEKGEGDYIAEVGEESGDGVAQPSKRTRELRKRADKRKSKNR